MMFTLDQNSTYHVPQEFDQTSTAWSYGTQLHDKTNVTATGTHGLPAYFTTQKLSASTTKLSYTPYQLELLNSIYKDMKYPNSVQKTLIAKRIGITRDQVKIWFQNRRRKDTINSQHQQHCHPLNSSTKGVKRTKSDDDDDESNDQIYDAQQQPVKALVNNQIIEGVLNELRSHKHAPSRLSSKRSKISHGEASLLNQNENQITLNNAETIADSQILKKTPNNCIIDLCPNIDKSSSMSDTSKENLTPPPPPLSLPTTSDQTSSYFYGASTQTSFTGEDTHPQQVTQKQFIKYQTFQPQSMSINSYLTKKYYPNYYYEQQQSAQTHQSYQQQWPLQPPQQQQQHQQQQAYQASNNYYNYQMDYGYIQNQEYSSYYTYS